MFTTTHIERDAEPPPVRNRKLIPRYSYSNHHLPAALQFEAYREMVLPLMELVPPQGTEEGFEASIKAWDLGSIVLTRSTLPATGFYRNSLHIRNSGLDHWCFVAVKTGNIQTFVRNRTNQVQPSSLFVKSLHMPVEGAMAETTGLCLFVPRDFCRERVSAIDAADDTVLNSGLGRLLASYLINLDRQLRWLAEPDLAGVLAATRAIIDACIEPTVDRLDAAMVPINATLLERAREMIHNNLLSPSLSVDEICRELGISRSRLYRLFESLGGVVHYIRSRRLLDAHRVLSGGEDNRSIVDIAAERDFLDPADFSRAFKREFGYSPKEARLRPRPPTQQHPVHPEQDGSLGDLLCRLV